MRDALVAMSPYVIGLIVSPIPVAVAIMLLVSTGGLRRATAFELSWLVISLLVIVAIAALVGQATPRGHDDTPTWETVVVIAVGVVLLLMALIVLAAWRRQLRHDGEMPAPRWMRALDGLSIGKTAGLAGVLIVANPVNLSMLVAAGVELGHHRLRAVPNLTAAALFTLIGSLTMLTPWVVTLVSERSAGLLPAVRRWLLAHNNALTFWMTLAFGVLFLIRGLRSLS